VLGGTFDPVHRGHLAMARAARGAHGLEKVLLIPSAEPPHKPAAEAPAADRLAMARLAAEDEEGLEASSIEIDRSGVSYTVETLEALRNLYPGAELFFIVGEDSLADFFGWRNVKRILELARLVTVNRPGWSAVIPPDACPGAAPGLLERIERDRVAMPGVPVESRRIREAIRAGRPYEDDVGRRVAEYIRARGLYRST
jgi:nicotinate-nucleotide adenylyltransferase